jgi:hypothetical protein
MSEPLLMASMLSACDHQKLRGSEYEELLTSTASDLRHYNQRLSVEPGSGRLRLGWNFQCPDQAMRRGHVLWSTASVWQ